jgi:DNA-binding transcriptional MerR regulator
MFKIGQFSIITRLTIKTLRHYDELDLLKPAYVDEESGYRFYTGEQLPRVQKIISLKTIGFSLSEIAQLLAGDVSSDELVKKLEKKRDEVSQAIYSEQTKLNQLTSYLSTLKKEKTMSYHITIKDLPEVTVASMRKVIKSYNEFNTLYPKMGELMIKQKLECINPGYCFTLYHDGEYKETDIDVEICESVVKAGKNEDGMTFRKIPAVPQAACVIHQGPYTTIGKTYAALTKWIEDNGFEVTDLMRERYIDGIWNQEDPEKWITEIQAPIKKK